MYYEERIIRNRLCYRTSPDGQWVALRNKITDSFNALILLTDEERLEVFSKFCVHCGSLDPKCFCMCDD